MPKAHPCWEGPSGRIRGTTVSCWRGIRRPSTNNRQARMNPAGRDAFVAPESIAALSSFVVTGRSWLFAGMTHKTSVMEGLPDSPCWMAKWKLFFPAYLPGKSLFRKFLPALLGCSFPSDAKAEIADCHRNRWNTDIIQKQVWPAQSLGPRQPPHEEEDAH